MILPSVFVEIPAQNASLVPAKVTTNGQSVGRPDEIKAEPPIKSEIDNANQSQQTTVVAATTAGHKITKDVLSAHSSTKSSSPSLSSSSSSSPSPSPSPPSIVTASSNASNNTKFSSASVECNNGTTAANLTANLVTARPKVKCFKCEQCPFMSISQDGYNNHVQTVHNNGDHNHVNASNRSFRNKILCPGCENVFYSKMSLKIHLVNDHQMSRPEISQLLESLFAKKNNHNNKCSTNVTRNTDVMTAAAAAVATASTTITTTTIMAANMTPSSMVISPSNEKGMEKQKIYLKNVEVLQNPRFNACEFNVQNTPPPTILSPSETQSECSSNLTDDIVNTDTSIIIDEMNSFNRMPNVRTTFNQLDNNCLYQQHITSIEQTPFQMVSAAAAAAAAAVAAQQSLRSNDCMNLNDNRECMNMPMNAISPIIDDAQSNRPDSGSSVKFSENFLNTDNIWPITSNSTVAPATTTGNASDFTIYHSTHMNLNQLPSIRMLASDPSAAATSLISPAVKEKKKIYIKNIDILKEPLIKPVQTISLTDPNCRKNTLHLRTVDEVNLLIKPHDNNNFISTDGGVSLNEDDYRYVLDDTNEYNNLIPQYLENDVNDFMFSSESQIVSNPVEYYNGGSNSNYAITNLDSTVQNYPTTNNTNTFDSVLYESPDRNTICNGILGNIPSTDLFPMNHNGINLNGPVTASVQQPSQQHQHQQQQPPQQQPPPSAAPTSSSDDYLEHDDGNHFFGNKCMPMKSPLDSTDYMIVTSEEIIDILDLTNDEVEQILDDNMISSQDFDTFNSPRFNRVPRINFATNLTKVDHHHSPSPTPPPPPPLPSAADYYEGKTIDMRSSLETPTINLDSIAMVENNENNNDEAAIDNVVPKLATMTTSIPTVAVQSTTLTTPTSMEPAITVIADQMSTVKKKSGRTKGARQINGISNLLSNRNNVITTKCSISNCGMRFATRAAIMLHEQCHTPDNKEIRCPKCEIDVPIAVAVPSAAASPVTTTTTTTTMTISTVSSSTSHLQNDTISSSNNNNVSATSQSTATTTTTTTTRPITSSNRNWNWNTLHTHLWREHNIDMELYSCPHCSFKTPILSRLKNTHMKIHSDTRDFKCDFCPKAFKNARQMKNHRRIHTRTAAPPTLNQCKYCGQSFYSAKHLKEHYFTHNEAIEHQRHPFALQCDICSESNFSSKHALRIHHMNHFDEKRFNCDECDYKSNDHNAFRRHQMVHSKTVKYKCALCPFQCIQSTNYKNHILKNHVDAAKELMFMCDKCNFVTINKRMYGLHCLNHNNNQMSSVELV